MIAQSATKSNLTSNNRSNLQSAVGLVKGSSNSSEDLAAAVRKALSEGVGSAQIQTIAAEECINEVDYVPVDDPTPDATTDEKPKKKRRVKNANI
ncbi:MAG: hypothetical protein E6Q97_09970 [Desulfurellales bacterium]|nr:MAG: hypothetical protein E6Q97_09970 [Desulfurellales bacterium]